MNENLNLTEILKDCPKGTKLYSTVYGEVEFVNAEGLNSYPICIITQGKYEYLTKEGKLFSDFDGECTLFPSREERDWSKFKLKKERFDPKTLLPFDRVLAKIGTERYYAWFPDFISLPPTDIDDTIFCIGKNDVAMAIPYNDDTKHLIDTNEEAPEYYRYWED